MFKVDELNCLLRFNKHDLSDWDNFRKKTFLMAVNLKNDYSMPMSEVFLYDALMKTFYAECKFKIGAGAINKVSDARGLIQWTRRTRKKLNVPEDIHTRPLAEQVDHADQYFRYKIWAHKMDVCKIDSVIDIYCIVFAPARADKPIDYIVYSKGKAYSQNRGYDTNRDHKITKREIEERILRHYD